MYAATSDVMSGTSSARSASVETSQISAQEHARRHGSHEADFSSAFRGFTFGVSMCVPAWSVIALVIYWIAGGSLP